MVDRDNRTGAALDNLGHTTVMPLLLPGAGYWNHNSTAIGVALIWVAHIGRDRAFGYGQKYEHGFKATHLGGAAVHPSPASHSIIAPRTD